jgi:purine-binding chemotaxis protein CheW
MSATRQYCTFHVDDLYFGLEVLRVQEVIRSLDTTFVPLANPVVEGLINLRGQIVTAIDLRRRFSLAPRPDGKKPMNVIVRDTHGAVALLVDEIGDVISSDETLFEPPPPTLTGPARDLVTGVYKLKGRLLLILDQDRVINLPDAA